MVRPSKPTLPNSCSGCGATWTGVGAAHCGGHGCHATFDSVTLFDAHRMTTRNPADPGRCQHPATLREAGRRTHFFQDGMWRGPASEDSYRHKEAGRV